uniref:GH97_N domain-containing protein n=1 Tax=Schistosoma mansoni TaxID=6183 RepID=A0A3Q0KBC1_SCHMA
MNYLLVTGFFTICLLLPNTFAKRKSETLNVPFHINEKGDMVIEVGGVKFSLNSKQVLKFNDGESKTEIDFGAPTPEELENKHGTRRITEYFNESEEQE